MRTDALYTSSLAAFISPISQRQDMTLDEAHRLTLVILKQVMEEKLNEHNVQLAQVRLSSLIICSSSQATFALRRKSLDMQRLIWKC